MMRSLVAAVCITLSMHGSAAVDPQVEAAFRDLAPHPRLFTGWAVLENLRTGKETDPLKVYLRDCLVHEADALLAKPAPEYRREGRRLQSDAPLRGGIFALATAYRLTGDRRYAEKCRANALSACDWPDFCADHYLNCAGTLLGLAIAYDWCPDAFTPEDARKLWTTIKEKSFCADWKACKTAGWRFGRANWTQVCWCGVTAAALAFAEQEPETAKSLVDQARLSLPRPLAAYAPNGGYPEGCGYWGYGTLHQAMLFDFWESALGTDFGLSALPGFLQTGDFMLAMAGTSDRMFSYSDGGSARTPEEAQFYFARKTGRAGLVAYEVSKLRERQASGKKGKVSPLSLIWLDGAIKGKTLETSAPASYLSAGPNPVATLRGGANSFLGVKGGRGNFDHGHLDVGSFIYDAHGLRWALDLGAQNYHSLESLGTIDLWNVRQDSTRWSVFRLNERSHNIVTFPGTRPNVAGFAAVDLAGSRARLDLTPVYAASAKAAERTLDLSAGTGALTVRDTFSGVAPGARLRFAFLTDAEIALEGAEAVLRMRGKSVRVRSPGPVWSVNDVSKGENTWDCSNDRVRQLVYFVTAPADGVVDLTTVFTP